MQQEAIFFPGFFFILKVGRPNPVSITQQNNTRAHQLWIHPKKGVEGQEVKKEETLYYIY